jgi:hypothetical protein
MFVAGLVAVAGFVTSVGADESVGRYAIVVRKDVAAGPWGKVVRCLEAKYKGKDFAYDKSPEDVRRDVGAYHPRYVCFVCQPTENFPDFALAANTFCRTLDDDLYIDAIWGILTGFDQKHALELVKADPVVIQAGVHQDPRRVAELGPGGGLRDRVDPRQRRAEREVGG